MVRWKNNIKMDVKEIYVSTKNWIDLSQDKDNCRVLVNVALKLQVT